MAKIATEFTKEQIREMQEKNGKDFIERGAFQNCKHHLE
jgi:hypothetical protein